jgi:hypothetical protein
MQITVATSIKYGNYKHLQSAVAKIRSLIAKHLHNFKEAFDYKHDVTVHIRPIKGLVHGRALSKKNVIEIDPRYPEHRVLETIAHELTHSEQHNQDRLKHQLVNRQWIPVWNGSPHRRATTHQAYLNQPWEIEARARAAKFVEKYNTTVRNLTIIRYDKK